MKKNLKPYAYKQWKHVKSVTAYFLKNLKPYAYKQWERKSVTAYFL